MAKNNRPAPATQESEFNAFLKAEHIGKLGTIASLVLTGFNRRHPKGTYGPEIIVEAVDSNGVAYDFSMREGSPNHRKLFRAFGDDERKWKGAIAVKVQLSANKREFVSITEVEPDKVPF